MKCPYCNNEVPWIENKEKYGRNYGKSFMCYYCKPCDAYVGCHNNTKKALGTLANKELRELRMRVHAIIDPYWKSGQYTRSGLYKYLSKIIKQQYHTGEADVEMCKRIIEVVENGVLNGKNKDINPN